MNTMREDFEAWAKSERMNLNYALGMGDAFYSAETKAAWSAWQAAIAARQPVGEVVAYVLRKGAATGSILWTDYGIRADMPDGASLYAAPPQQPERVDLSALKALADRWEEIAEKHGVRQFTGNDHRLFANELRALINQQESKP